MQVKPNVFKFIPPTKVEFGPEALEILPDELACNELRRPAFVVTPSRKRSGMFEEPVEALRRHEIEAVIYSGARENPDLESLTDCSRFLKSQRRMCSQASAGAAR